MRTILPYLSFLLLIGLGNPVDALTVSGTIINSTASPLAGVKVRLAVLKLSDTTDALGKFSLSLPTVGLIRSPQRNGSRTGFSSSALMVEGQDWYRIDGSRVKSFRGNMVLMERSHGNAGASPSPLRKSSASGTKDTLVFEKSGYALLRLPILIITDSALNVVLKKSDTVFTACNAALNALSDKIGDVASDSTLKKLEAYGNVCFEQAAAIAALPDVSKLPDIKIRSLLAKANTYLGVPYVFGAGDYDKTKVFDCSSFTQYIFGMYGVILRRVSNDQAAQGVRIDNRNMLRPGDLVFFHIASRTVEVGHVGIYIGHGQMINANTGPLDGVQISPVNWTKYLWAVKVAR